VLRAPEPKPLSRADLGRKLDGGGAMRRAGRAGDDCSGRTTAGELFGLEGRRGGWEGWGGSAMRLGGREGVLFSASFGFALGGSGGRLACSRGGGSLLRVCVSGPPLEVADLVWLSDRLDTADN
jgi:hypothetical protein